MTREEFDTKFQGMRDKLDPSEIELLDTIIGGAELNHSIVYAAIAYVFGVLSGIGGILLVL